MNSESMISKIVDHKITLEKVKGTGPRLKDSIEKRYNGNVSEDLFEKMEQLKKCVKLELYKPSTIWPYFGNLRL